MNSTNFFLLNDLNLLKKILLNFQTNRKKIIITNKRSTQISKILLGQKISIHNGKVFKTKTISLPMLKHKLGEFINTRIPHTFKQKKIKKKKIE